MIEVKCDGAVHEFSVHISAGKVIKKVYGKKIQQQVSGKKHYIVLIG